VTAARADEWVALRPGTEAALALGIAYVMITEGLYDASFVRERTFGFEDWTDPEGKAHQGFRSLVLAQYRLNDVAAMTGVAPETILRLAREFGQSRPALAIGDHQTSTLPGNPYAAMAVHSLNALVGSLNTAGGVLVQTELPLAEEESSTGHSVTRPRIDQMPERLYPEQHLARLPQAILSRDPYPVQALLLHNVNPVFSMPNGEAFRRSLLDVPFIISFTFAAPLSAASVDGIAIHSSAVGTGPTIVFVHGWTCDSSSWVGQVPAFASEYRVITLDLPGHGQSQSPRDGKFSMDLFARAVEAVRADANAERIVLVGHSMGGTVSLSVAIKYPQRASKVVVAVSRFNSVSC